MNSLIKTVSNQREAVAWKFGSFARTIDKSRSWLYALPPNLQPQSIKFGRNRLIVESPQDFLRRLAGHQALAAQGEE